MFITECKADYLGHQIVAHTSWGFELSLKGIRLETKLYIDGTVVDTTGDLFALGDKPIMRGSITGEDGKIHVVEVYAKSALTKVLLRINADGQKIAGDDF